MKRFSAPTIQEALKNASVYFGCPQEELEYEIALEPKSGFLGFGKQDGIIVARKREANKSEIGKSEANKSEEVISTQKLEEFEESFKAYEDDYTTPTASKSHYSQIEENFFQERMTPSEIARKLSKEITELFALLPYEIECVKVRVEQEIVYVEFFGADCGLLIGERGYRYSSIYHLLAIWIKKEYGMGLRLEIADFLKNKEKKIEEYLEENYDQIISRTFFQSRTFDPLTASIALRRFREAIPDKYIIIKQVSEIESVISINEFRTK